LCRPIASNPTAFGLDSADGMALQAAFYACTTQRAVRTAADTLPARGGAASLPAMSTLAEIEEAVATLPRPEQEVLLRHLSAKLRALPASGWPVPPPDVPREELQRVHALIEAEFSRVDAEGW